MRRLIAVLVVGLVSLGVAHTNAAGPTKARLSIIAPADMEFRTLYLQPLAFSGSRSWTLKPGTYVVVQAPPYPLPWRFECTGNRGYGQFDLKAGDSVTCTFTVL